MLIMFRQLMSKGWGQTLSMVLSDRTRGNRHNVERRKFNLNMRKIFSGTGFPERLRSLL